jgi:hypothetical protein
LNQNALPSSFFLLPQREMKKKITWNAANIEEILHFQTEAPVCQVWEETPLHLADSITVQQGSISSNSPIWSLADSRHLVHYRHLRIGLEDVDVVVNSKLFALFSVPNLAYHKVVQAIYSLDDWATVQTVDLTWHSQSLPHTDLFQFHLNLADCIPISATLHLAIRYTYWNDGNEEQKTVLYENASGRNIKIDLRCFPFHRGSSMVTCTLKPGLRKSMPSSRRLVSLAGRKQNSWSNCKFQIPKPPSSMLNSYVYDLVNPL